MPLTPAVIEAANAFRARLLQRERQAATAMVRYYGTSWTRIHADIMALSREVQAMQAQGLEPSREDIISLERMRNIEAQVERELDRFAEFADGEITARQREAIATGERDAYQLMQLSLPGEHSVRIDMFRMPREAVENYVGMMQDGTPLREILRKYVDGAAQSLSETLVTGMVAGWNPRKVAREVRNAYGMALSDAMRLARTEQLRAYRTANLQSYQANSDVVTSWKRMSARLPNSCIACIMLDGKVYTLGEPMDDHPNGKCFMVPVTKTYAELGIDAPEPTFNPGTGREWFEGQTPAMQRGIMGPGMFDAWQDGRFALEDIPKLVEDATWGNHWTPRSLYDLLGESGPVGTYRGWVAAQSAEITWAPSMTREQADAWAVQSAYKDPVFHGTVSGEASAGIRESGFDLSRVTNGRAYGDGVYTAMYRDAAALYADGDNLLEIRVNVRSVRTADWKEWADIYREAAELDLKTAESIGIGPDDGMPATITKYLQSQGYDALRFTGEEYLVIFDPKNVTVIN